MTKNQRRTSPRISVSMTPETYRGLVQWAKVEGRSVSHVTAEILGCAVAQRTLAPTLAHTEPA